MKMFILLFVKINCTISQQQESQYSVTVVSKECIIRIIDNLKSLIFIIWKSFSNLYKSISKQLLIVRVEELIFTLHIKIYNVHKWHKTYTCQKCRCTLQSVLHIETRTYVSILYTYAYVHVCIYNFFLILNILISETEKIDVNNNA